jgi:hypothetical protein
MTYRRNTTMMQAEAIGRHAVLGSQNEGMARAGLAARDFHGGAT